MEKGLVSAIILTHNRLDLLKRAIQSVFEQTYDKIECIVVDNGATDGTEDYCKSLPNIIYIRHEPTIGNGANQARNVGIRASHGEWCAFLDDDDCWFPTKTERQLALAKEKGCKVVYCSPMFENIKQDGISYWECPVDPEMEGDLSKKCFYQMFSISSQFLVERQLLEDVGLFDENCQFWHEVELLMRLSQKSLVYAVHEPLVYYRNDMVTPARQSNKYSKTQKDTVKYIYHKHAGLIRRLSLHDRLLVRKRILADRIRRCEQNNRFIELLWLRCQRKSLKWAQAIVYSPQPK